MEIPHTLVETLDVSWQQCGACWGQRMVLLPAPAGGYASRSCDHCMGIGERMSVTANGPLRGAA